MNIWLSETIVRAVGWTLVHFMWEGLVIAAVLATALRVMRRSPAHWRYLVGCAAMAAMAVAPLVTFQLVLGQDAPPQPAAMTPEVAQTIPVEPPLLPDASAPASGVTLPITRANTPSLVGDDVRSLKSIRLFGHQLPIPYSVSRLIDELQRLEAWLPWLVTGWLAGVCLLSCRLLAGWWQVRLLARTACGAAGEMWEHKLAQLARRLGVNRSIRLLQSAPVEVPTVVGWLRPVILLPASCLTGLSPGQLEAILAHELAHIRRHDYLINLLQSAVETLLFYHPAVWWVSRKVREERENCCDDLAVAVSGDRVGYARALATLEELRPASAQLALAASGAPLLRRIRRLAGRPERTAGRTSWPVAGIVLLLGLGLVALGMHEHHAQAAEANLGLGADAATTMPTNMAPVVRDFFVDLLPPDQTKELLASATQESVVPPQSNEGWHLEVLDNRAVTNAGESTAWQTRTFRVEPGHFEAELAANLRRKVGPGGNAGRTTSIGGSALTNVTVSGSGSGLGTRSPNASVLALDQVAREWDAALQPEDVESAIRDYFKGTGVDLSTNSGKAVIFDNQTGDLTVRTTPTELDLIGRAVASLNELPPEVNIKTRFIEFDERDENLLDVLASEAPRITNSGMSPASVGLPGRTGWAATPRNGLVSSNDSATNRATITSFLTDVQFRSLLSAFEKRDGTEFLTAPEVTTESGRQAQMQAVDIQQIVTGVGGPGLTPTTTTMSFGPELDVVPYVDANRSNITMAIIPSITDFIGYDNPGQFVPTAFWTNGGKITAVLPLPHFRLRQAVASVTVRDGQTLVISGFETKREVHTVKESVPVLGSVPLLGRLFQEQHVEIVKRGLVVFVTATIVNSDGTRYHPVPAETAHARADLPAEGGK